MRNNNIIFTWGMAGILALGLACERNSNIVDGNTQYDIDKPDKIYQLPKILEEISGLTAVGNGLIACVQDELGQVFVYDTGAEKIIQTIEFGKDGDYEGLELVGGTMFVLRNSGTVIEMQDYLSDSMKVRSYNSFLKKDNDTEGLAYDAGNNRLLIACKGDPGKGRKLSDEVAFYGFNLRTKKVKEQPALLIPVDSIEEYSGKSKNQRIFRPSGIAIHPQSGHIYAVSSIGKILVVLTVGGQVLQKIPLNPRLFPQPEGITFDEVGDLFISNEGDGRAATLLKFVKKERF